MKKSIFLILGIFFVGFISAQNISQTDKTKGQKDLNLPKLIPAIPNPSFEDTLFCPTSFSQMSSRDYWMQAGGGTSDYFDTCDYMPVSVPQPLPDGSGCTGEIFKESWKEYIGICLPQPLDSGINYSFTIDVAFEFTDDVLNLSVPTDSISPVNITLYGDVDCSYLPFSSYGCPVGIGGWQELGYVTVNPYDIYGVWDTYTITFTPNQDISALVLGPPCTLPPDSLYQNMSNYALPYFFFDNINSSYNSVQVESSIDEFLTIFPNPGNGEFTLSYDIGKEANASLDVFSVSGQLLMQDHISGLSNQKTLDLTQFPNGIYLLKVKTDTKVMTKKIVINK